MKLNRMLFAGFVAALAIPAHTHADDTDIYLNPAQNKVRPQVLIIFDNSASMDTLVEGLPGGYINDPNKPYLPIDSAHSYDDGMIYFTIGTGLDESGLGIPDSPSETNRFNDLLNGCYVARKSLEKYGRFSGHIREYIQNGNGKGTWQPIKQNSGKDENNPVDCWEDVDAGYESNNNDTTPSTGFMTGYPQDSKAEPWGPKAAVNNFNSGELVTLYTANYLRWYREYQKKLEEGNTTPGTYPDQTRLAIAKDAISSVVSTVFSIDFGLAVYNLNYPKEGDSDGGRIVAAIKPRTPAEKDALIKTITNLPADTNTPLCETLYEAFRYFSGGEIKYGHADKNYNGGAIHYTANQPMYDTSAESNGSYISPLSKCNKVGHIIYITDGAPVLDTSADTLIQSLGGKPYTYAEASGDIPAKTSYLPALAEYMFNNDLDNNDDNGFQRVITHTIGFSLGKDEEHAEPLLIETAKRSGDFGTYTAADNTVELVEAITKIVAEIEQTGQRFSAPGVAFSSADPTRTLDAAYYALFEPSQSPKWTGNLKKLKVNSSGVLVDATGKGAIDSSGGLAATSCTIWSYCSAKGDIGYVGDDGNEEDGANIVAAGGAARRINPASRTIYSDFNSELQPLVKDTAAKYAQDISSPSESDMYVALARYMGLDISDASNQLTKAFRWIFGWNVDVAKENTDGSVAEYTSIGVGLDGAREGDIRADIMGDPLHSRPLAIDYGNYNMIFVGTNHGMMHAFKDEGDKVTESWAFLPYQLLPNLSRIRSNNYALGHAVYGLDGTPIAYVDRGDTFKAWLYFGMGRGGQSYFAMDVSTSTPKLKWEISNTDSGFEELGQTWSTPVITKIPANDGKPVLIFGGGYNNAYDSGSGKDSDGRMVYIVDADTGTLLRTFGVGDGPLNTVLPGITDSIVGSIATLDSNGDGITDRLYASDLGGNVWRMDMPSTTPSAWGAYKFAELGGTGASDRRFFYEPAVAQTYFTNISKVSVTDADGNVTTAITSQNVSYDAVTLGSGNRADPLSTNVDDKFFVLQDRNVVTQQFGDGDGQMAVPSPIKYTDLYDVATQGVPDTQTENINFGEKRGWYYSLSGSGEKSLSPAVIIKGKVYFTSFTPAGPAQDADTCAVLTEGKLYTFDLHKGGLYSEMNVCDNCIPQPPTIITPPIIPAEKEGEQDIIPDPVLIIGKGTCDKDGQNCTGTVDLDSGLDTNKIYYHIDE
ncbi:pilus assembly protein [Shewanella acanthi]|uniref:pilus assembly protein n=1 Tax=Shewanella acanthi TaxID=2864212 RepID=UPI001C657D45|nr:PilC/PilY family type IV pilus protein [Shewanella acanthi]QYJ78073.1 type IV pilin biogenesis protein [Shewanella acanthi]